MYHQKDTIATDEHFCLLIMLQIYDLQSFGVHGDPLGHHGQAPVGAVDCCPGATTRSGASRGDAASEEDVVSWGGDCLTRPNQEKGRNDDDTGRRRFITHRVL